MGARQLPSWGEKCLGCAEHGTLLFESQGKREWGAGGQVQKGNEVGSHNPAWDKTSDWELLGPLESKEAANPIKDPPASSCPAHHPEWGCPAALGAPSPLPSELRPHSPSPPVAHGAGVPRRSSRACSREHLAAGNVALLLHTGHVLLGEVDHGRGEAAGTSTGLWRRHQGDSVLVWISPAEPTQWTKVQANPTPRFSSPACKPRLPSCTRAPMAWHPLTARLPLSQRVEI